MRGTEKILKHSFGRRCVQRKKKNLLANKGQADARCLSCVEASPRNLEYSALHGQWTVEAKSWPANVPLSSTDAMYVYTKLCPVAHDFHGNPQLVRVLAHGRNLRIVNAIGACLATINAISMAALGVSAMWEDGSAAGATVNDDVMIVQTITLCCESDGIECLCRGRNRQVERLNVRFPPTSPEHLP